MNIGVSPITNTIYAGRSKDNGDGIKEWVGEKQDITDEAIRAVFDWFINNFKANEPNEAFEVKFTNCPYRLMMTRENEFPAQGVRNKWPTYKHSSNPK